MGEIVCIKQLLRKRQSEILIKGLTDLYGDADDNLSQFIALVEMNLSDAIKRLPEFIKKARAINPNRAFVEAVAGGPNHDWIVPLLNILGDHYEVFERSEREQILRHCLGYFDGLNYCYSQNHVEMMSSPFLITDIVMSRWLYWPGLSKPRALLSGSNLKDLTHKDKKIMGNFWVCLAIIWNDDSITLPLRHWYYKNYPDIVENTLSFAAAHTYFCAKGKENEETDIQITSTLNKVYDPVLHNRIREKIKEENWIRIS